MQLHLRDIIDESVKDLLRFFTAIPTLEDLQRELRGKPLRRVDYDCKLPDFCDLQDHVQPLFKLVLDARSGSSIDDSITLAFEEDDGTILQYSMRMLDSILKAFDDFPRPEFCKVKLASIAKYESERKDADKQDRQYLLSKRKATPHKEAEWAEKVLNFERKLGPNLRRYFGRIQVEVIKQSAIDSFPGSLRPFLEKNFRFQHDDQCYRQAREMLKACITKHLSDAHRVFEIFHPFRPLVDGTLSKMVISSLSSTEVCTRNV